MTRVTHSFELAASTFQSALSTNHFGSSFENRGQSLDRGSPFATVMESLDISLLRYPGGSQTEAFFNPANPNASQHASIFNPASVANFEPIEKFISYCAQQGVRPAIVIPTFRYFDKSSPETGYLAAGAAEQIGKFVTDVVAGKYGNIDISAFEIGNEWFNARMLHDSAGNPDGWTAREFGVLQGRIVDIVQAAVSAAKPAVKPDIWVQSGQTGDADIDGNGRRDNVEILSGLAQVIDHVDGVVDHFYQPTRGSTPLEVLAGGWVASNRIDRLVEDGWDVGPSGRLDVVASEWNLRAARNGDLSGDNANITGFERLPLVVAQFADMVAAGVDWAMIYTVQGLGSNGGSGTLSWFQQTSLTPTGQLFQMMADALPGTKLVDPDGNETLTMSDYVLKDNSGESAGFTFTFSGSDRLVAYFASAVNAEMDFSIAGFQRYIAAGWTAEAMLLRPEAGFDPVDAEARGEIVRISGSAIESDILADGLVQFTLGAYQVLQITFLRDEAGAGSARALEQAASDPARGTTGGDRLNGSSAGDRMFGYAGSDTLIGNAGADSLFGGSGRDLLQGGAGDDVLSGGRGEDTLNGGDGVDWADYSGALGSVQADLQTAGQNRGDAQGDVYQSIENLTGSDFNDNLRGNNQANQLVGGFGKDILNGRSGNDTLDGGDGDDSLSGEDGADQLWGGAGSDRLDGGAGNDTLVGGSGDDLLIGGAGFDLASYASATAGLILGLAGGAPLTAADFGSDTLSGIEGLEGGSGGDILTGDTGANLLLGRAGADTLQGGLGNDTLDGGAGQDTASYAGASAGVTVTLDTTKAQATRGAGTDVLSQIEDLTGSAFDDVLTGNAGANRIQGGGGRDILTGAAGADTLEGNDGNDLFLIAAFADHAVGEMVLGGAGVDELRYVGTGAGTLVLGAGVDVERVSIGTGSGAAAVTSGKAAINIDASAMAQGVALTGNAGSNRLTGTAWNDTLDGGAGNDTLLGGAGNDILTGGAGSDTFIFTDLATSGRDAILDFNPVADSIMLRGNFSGGAGRSVLDPAAFAINATGLAENAQHRIIYNAANGQLLFDPDGNGQADSIHFATLRPGLGMTANDFLMF